MELVTFIGCFTDREEFDLISNYMLLCGYKFYKLAHSESFTLADCDPYVLA